jgi:integrase
MGLIVRGTTYYLRLNVPKALQEIVGRKEFVRSLGTNRCIEAARKARAVSADFEGWLRDMTGSTTSPLPVAVPTPSPAVQEDTQTSSPASFAAKPAGKTVREVCEIFLSDPTKNRSDKAASGYWNAVELAEAVLGKSKAMADIDRQCARDIVATLKLVPSNAKKRFPSLDYRQAAEKGRTGRYRLLGPKSVNDYLIKLSTLSNFAIDEGFIGRNPFRGLKVADDVHPRDKRYPFSNDQLVRIFNAPLYRGCRDGEAGYCIPGHARPRQGRFWIPLIGLFSGMRLNEICQMDLADIRSIGGIDCFSVNTETIRGDNDKKVKTMSSRRVVPIHRSLIKIGFMDYVADQRGKNCRKLFPELNLGTTGYYSDPFSKWFLRFMKKAGASSPKTSFHSFRHCFRDALREAKLEHEIALALGGWASATGDTEIAANYGRGFPIEMLKEAIDQIAYPALGIEHLVQ